MWRKRKWLSNEIIGSFEAHLKKVCGLEESTCCQYAEYTREFLKNKYGNSVVYLERLKPEDLLSFVSGKARCYSPETTRSIATSLRSFLRFLQFNGLCDAKLVDAVPSVPNWKQASLPKSLDENQIAKLLDSFNRSTPIGMRDYAMVVCLVGLGLRTSEVANLSLEDINWRKGTIRISTGKSRRSSLLPLTESVGRAIASYLRNGRPSTGERRIFVSHGWPKGASIGSGSVSGAVRKAFYRTGLDVPSKGAHILRHTAATRMIQHGASLKEIADVLRHRSIQTTTIYAKVNLPMLAEVAMPWPKEATDMLRRPSLDTHLMLDLPALTEVAMPWPEVA
jgi:integrase/recombinase XerD